MRSFITSQFSYCPIIWMYCQRKSDNLINRIHERALRLAYNDYSSGFSSLSELDNSVTIHHRNILALSLEIYKSVNNLNPVFMKDVFHLKQQKYLFRNLSLFYPNPSLGLKHLVTEEAKSGTIFQEKFKYVQI